MSELDKARRKHDSLFRVHDIDRALIATCAHFGMLRDEVLGDCRYAHIAYPRHVSMFIAWKYLRASQSRIGRFFNRDHTTARTACLNIQRLAADSPLVRRDIAMILDILSDFDLNVSNYWGA